MYWEENHGICLTASLTHWCGLPCTAVLNKTSYFFLLGMIEVTISIPTSYCLSFYPRSQPDMPQNMCKIISDPTTQISQSTGHDVILLNWSYKKRYKKPLLILPLLIMDEEVHRAGGRVTSSKIRCDWSEGTVSCNNTAHRAQTWTWSDHGLVLRGPQTVTSNYEYYERIEPSLYCPPVASQLENDTSVTRTDKNLGSHPTTVPAQQEPSAF